MNERLQKFLKVKKLLERIDYEEEKEKTLIELGLYDKVYSPDNNCTGEYSFSEWDEETSKTKYYKKVPIEATDEEYEEVKKYATKEDKNEIENNPIAIIITVVAWLAIIGGIISSIILGFVYLCVGLISGTIFLGFAEIIKLLDAIKKK